MGVPEATVIEGNGPTGWSNVSYLLQSVGTGFPTLDLVNSRYSQDMVTAASPDHEVRITLSIGIALELAGLDVFAHHVDLSNSQDKIAPERTACGLL